MKYIFIFLLTIANSINAEIKDEGIVKNISEFLSYNKDETDIRNYLLKRTSNSSQYYIIIIKNYFITFEEGIQYPIYYDNIIIAEIIDKQNNISKIEVNSWIVDIKRNKKTKILSYNSISSIDNDGYKLVNNSPITTLTSEDNIEWARFVYSSNDIERMFITNSYMKDYAENSPTNRCKAFNQLYSLFKKINNIDFNNIQKIMSFENSSLLDNN